MFYTIGKRISILSLIISFCLIPAFAQVQWRPVSPAELAMKTPKVEADADAEAIFWEVRIDDSDSSDLALDHYVRVKIFTERGRERFSKIDIPFIKGEMKIKNIAARIIRPDGSIVEIGKDDIFEREIVKANKVKIRAKSFAVPNIEPGVIVEYQYREQIEDAGASGMTLEFQRDIPVQNLSYFYKPYNKREPSYQLYNFRDTKFIKDDKGFYRATRLDVPALKEEPYMPPEDMVRPWMMLQGVRVVLTDASAFSVSYAVKNPGNPTSYWGAVGSENKGLVEFMNKSDKNIKKTAEQVTVSATNDEDKLRKLYEYVQTQIKNTSFDSSIDDEARKKLPKTKSVGDVLKNQQGSSQFIDMLFGSMANSLGFETRVAFAANRNKMFFDPKMTNENFIHPAAVAVKVGDNWKFFNPGVKFLPYGKLVWYEEDVWALLIGEKQLSWEKTPLTDFNETVSKRTGKFKLLADGTLEGNVRIEHTGHKAIQYRLDNFDVSQNQREENLMQEVKSQISAAEISGISIENLDSNSKPLVVSYKVRVPNYAQKTGKRIFVQPNYFEYGDDPVFSSASRKYDIYFHYPWSEVDDIEFQLPEGYQFDNAESPADVFDNDKIGYLENRIRVNPEATFMKLDRKFHFGGNGMTLFKVANYELLKRLFDSFHKADTQPITLKQK